MVNNPSVVCVSLILNFFLCLKKKHFTYYTKTKTVWKKIIFAVGNKTKDTNKNYLNKLHSVLVTFMDIFYVPYR